MHDRCNRLSLDLWGALLQPDRARLSQLRNPRRLELRQCGRRTKRRARSTDRFPPNGPRTRLSGSRLPRRSEEHTSELQSLMRISYAIFCLKKKKILINRYNYKTILLTR